MSQKLLGRKAGMTQRFDDSGNAIACTVISCAPNVVSQIKTVEKDGYIALQTAFEEYPGEDKRRQERLAGQPRAGHFKKGGIAPRRFVTESRFEKAPEVEMGAEIGVDLFQEGQYVDVAGVTKGKGYQGVIKLHGFAGGPGAHGSGFHRLAGSTGMRSTPGRCFKGGKRASQMGGRRRTIQSLRVIAVMPEKGLLLVAGSVPGAAGDLVTVTVAKKKAA
ncbi:MAG: 50S ribosomal protein L3 [Parachlamydiales bacterium]